MAQKNKESQIQTPPEMRDEVIDRLYEVAIDPMRYEELLDHWENMISPLRKGANGQLVNIDLDAEYISHFSRAGKFLEKFDDNTEETGFISQTDNTAALLIDRSLRIVDANRPAEIGLSITKGNTISALPIESDDLEALEHQIQRMIISNSDQSAFFRTRLHDSQHLVLFRLQTLRPKDAQPLVIAVTSEVVWPPEFDALLHSAFGLTNAEIGIVRGLVECQSLSEIARSRKRSIDTVRAQLKSALSKTETRSQTELVRLTLSMMHITAYTEDTAAEVSEESTGSNQLQPRPFYQVNLKDGRRMDYLILGDPKGRPCIFLPLDFGLTRWPASAEKEAEKRGIKVIVPVRAGYGNSSPFPKGKELGPTIADDLVQLLDHLGVQSCPFISLSSDVFYSAYFHQAHPDRITAIIACSGSFPLDRSAQYERMDKWHRFILASARYTPHLLPFMVKAGFSLARKLGKNGFVHAVFGNSKADVATFEEPEVFEAMVTGSEVCLSDTRSAHKAFAREVIAQETTDWAPVLEQLEGRIPVHYLCGHQDPQVPYDTIREFQQKYTWITYHDYPDAGQLLFFRKWRDVINMLEKYL